MPNCDSTNTCTALQQTDKKLSIVKALVDERQHSFEAFKDEMKDDLDRVHVGIANVSDKIDSLSENISKNIQMVATRVTILETKESGLQFSRRWQRALWTSLFLAAIGGGITTLIKVLAG